MAARYKIMIMGASYGSLLASKFLLAGHSVKLVCLPDEAGLINKEGIRIKMPIRGREGLVEISSTTSPGMLTASPPQYVNPLDYDLVVLAMQEPQYRSPGVKELLWAVAKAEVPCMSIMNMPPLPFLARFSGVDIQSIRSAYADPTVWDAFNPALMTLCSPDPQAFRPPEEKSNVLQVRLPTNFKAARFESDVHTKMLRQLEEDISAIRFELDNGELIELPVKLKLHESLYVPLAKWSMLIAGNYRCIQESGIRSAKSAVHTDLAATQRVYEWVVEVCKALGAPAEDMVPFQKYAIAALSLESPSSAARALFGGATHIERVDLLVQVLAAQKGMELAAMDEIVTLVDDKLKKNRTKALRVA